MNALVAIARTQFRRTMRSRVFLACVLVAIACAAIVVEPIVNIRTQTPGSVAAAAAWEVISLFSTLGFGLVAILGVSAIHSETRDKTWQALLCKPISPWKIVVGKFLGVMAVMSALTAFVWGCVHVLVAVSLHRYFPRLDLALAFELLGLTIPAALAICLSLRIHPIASAIIVLLLRYDALDALFDAVTSSQHSTAVLLVPATLIGAARAIAPPYDLFILGDTLSSAATILWGRQLWITGYATALVALVLASASYLLRHRELAKAV
jgi:ABC-type transport system involved in multi-copper enzyme maturation permease subunit